MEWNVCWGTMFVVYGVVLTNHMCLSYLNYTMEASKLCSPFKNNTLRLGTKYNEHGIVISETSSDYWFGRKISKCKFEVKAYRKNKIIAVIQKLSFRQDESGNCTDYVQFRSGTEESEKFCGFIRAMHSDRLPENPNITAGNIAPNAFVVHNEGKLDVTIYVANKKLLPEEELDLEIVFTSAQDCPSASHEYSVCGYNLCILRAFLKDGFVNCPFVNCPDEDGCYKPIPARISVGSKVTIGAVTAVLMSFILFLGCIWLSRRYHKICWSAEFNRGRITRMLQISPAVCQQENSACCAVVRCQHEIQSTQSTPSAPFPAASNGGELAVASAATPDDRDLPPPYELLFPGR